MFLDQGITSTYIYDYSTLCIHRNNWMKIQSDPMEKFGEISRTVSKFDKISKFWLFLTNFEAMLSWTQLHANFIKTLRTVFEKNEVFQKVDIGKKLLDINTLLLTQLESQEHL